MAYYAPADATTIHQLQETIRYLLLYYLILLWFLREINFIYLQAKIFNCKHLFSTWGYSYVCVYPGILNVRVYLVLSNWNQWWINYNFTLAIAKREKKRVGNLSLRKNNIVWLSKKYTCSQYKYIYIYNFNFIITKV